MSQPIFAKHLNDCEEFSANDGCRLRELLHPKNDSIELPYSFSVATVDPGKSTYRHYLKQSEVYFILKGHGRLHVEDSSREVYEGDAALVPPEKEQWLENIDNNSPLEFIAIVSPPWRAEDDIRT